MRNYFRKLMVAGALVLATMCCATASAVAQDDVRSFTVINRSSLRIDHLYVSSSNYRFWGWDQLGRDVLYPDYRFQMSVTPGWYDVKLVDKDGDACVVSGMDFRYGDTWTITDGILLACEMLSN